MNINDFYAQEGEKPLDNLVTDGGFCGIFRTIGCVGDSLSSGELESMSEDGVRGYHDYFDYSWGQYMARMAGFKAYNFSRGGMTAKEYMESFAEANGFWDPSLACQGYIIALGCNDLYGRRYPVGSTDDICREDYTKNKDSFAGDFAAIIQRLKEISPKARFFLVTLPRAGETGINKELADAQAELMNSLADFFEFTYVIDLRKYGPEYDEKFKKNFYLGGHLNASGYLLTARMLTSYIDYIIRHNPDDFKQLGFVGTPFHYHGEKW